jgi:hypothetical protein
MHFAYITTFRVEGKQMRIIHKPRTLSETVSYKVLPLGNNVYMAVRPCLAVEYKTKSGRQPLRLGI